MISIKTNIITFLVLTFSVTMNAQQILNLKVVDELTYEYYTANKWEELITLGEKALDEKINFYYLDYRMGVAYYSLKKYRKSIPFFEQVLNTTPNDAVAEEYLYYSYLLGGRTSDANKILLGLTRKHKHKIQYYKTNNLFNGLGAEYKYYFFSDFAISNKVNNQITQKVRNSMNYFSGDLLNITKNNSVFYMNFALIKGTSSIYNALYSPEIIDEKLKQYQIYVSVDKRISKGLNLKLSATFMRENLKWYEQPPYSDIEFYNGSTNNFVGFLSLTKRVNNFDLSLGTSVAKVNNESQAQPFASVVWYPFSNKSFYGTTTANYQFNFADNTNNNLILKQSFTAEIIPSLSLKAFGLYGKVYNFIDNDGQSIYNNFDAIDYWYGASMNYYFGETTQAYIVYRNDGQTNEYTLNTDIKEIEYNVNSILLGLRFNF